MINIGVINPYHKKEPYSDDEAGDKMDRILGGAEMGRQGSWMK